MSKPRAPRLTSFAVIALILTAAIALLAPHLLSVTLYKLSLVTLAAVLGYWIDRVVFPYARPCWPSEEKFSDGSDVLDMSNDAPMYMLRRAILMAAVILAIALGA